jgi:hypothetical protein
MPRLPLLALILSLPATSAVAANSVVIGDSLGVGVSIASGLKGLAANSVTIRGPRVIEQIRRVSPGTVAYMSLGTNDAVGPVRGLEKSIDAVVAAAERGRVKLIWLGPPCVHKAWDKNARELDGMLRMRLAGTGVTYVSMRDGAMCGSDVRARDGVHFTMKGYGYMWAKAQSATGVRVASAEVPKPGAAMMVRALAPEQAPLRPIEPEWIGAGALNWFHPGSILRSPR